MILNFCGILACLYYNYNVICVGYFALLAFIRSILIYLLAIKHFFRHRLNVVISYIVIQPD